jgi:phosphoribosylformylglycinamidine synthase
MPFISGKDSLSSTYRNSGQLIKIPPVLCVSAFGRIEDIKKTVTADFKKTGTVIVLVGSRNPSEMAGSVYCKLAGVEGANLPRIDLASLKDVFTGVHRAISEGRVLACHDISEGGLAVALAEMCLGGGMGCLVEMKGTEVPEEFLFNETAGNFLLEVENTAALQDVLGRVPHRIIGKTVPDREIKVFRGGKELFSVETEALREAWQRPMREVFGS